MEHVLDALTVDLLVWDVDDLGASAGELEDAGGKFGDGHRLRRADVEDLAARRRVIHQRCERADRVLHMAEAARLRAVAVNLDRASREGRTDEARDHHSVLAALPRADGVEEAGDDAVESALLVIGECQKLVERLRLGIRPATRRRRPVQTAALLVERLGLAAVAVYLGGRSDEHALAEAIAVLQHVLRPLDVRDECVHRLLDDQPYADGGCEVEDDVAAMHELVDDRRLQHGVDDQMEVAALAEMRDVPLGARREIVECEDLPAVAEEEPREVRADEAGAARDERAASLRH